MIAPPKIDRRRAAEVVGQVRRLLAHYLPEWERRPGDAWPAGDPGAALVEIFGRFAEVAIERLNRSPEKHFLAFLEMIGTTLLAPTEARAPVQFFLAARATASALVPRETPLASGGPLPQAFETERDLHVSPARLVRAVTFDPRNDRVTDHSPLVGAAGLQAPSPLAVFEGQSLLDHVLYLGQDAVLGASRPSKLSVLLQLVPPAPELESDVVKALESLTWWARIGGEPRLLPPTHATASPSGLEVDFGEVPGIDAWVLAGKSAHWLWANAGTPLTWTGRAFPEALRIAVRSQSLAPGPLDGAIANGSPVDLVQGSFPFGTRPKIGDALHLRSQEFFARSGARIELRVDVGFPQGKDLEVRPISLRWEFWDGDAWEEIGTSNESGPDAATGPYEFQDKTHAFTNAGAGLKVSFLCPPAVRAQFGGLEGLWIRVRIASGDYGEDAKLTLKANPPPENPTLADWVYKPPTFRPPFLASLSLTYAHEDLRDAADVVTRNGFTVERRDTHAPPLVPFQPPEDEDPVLALGFDAAFSNRPMSLYLAVAERTEPPAGGGVAWEYWNGQDWSALGLVRDETQGLTEPGILEFLGPQDLTRSDRLGGDLHWIRARLVAGDVKLFAVSAVHPNTTWARHAATLRDEVIGSSNGKPRQVFTASRLPVLAGQTLEVREPEEPPADELAGLVADGESNAVRVVRDEAGRPREVWVRWHEVDHFQLSGPHSRHYVVDRARGRFQTGDGRRGRILPPGRDNVRLAEYRAGGGRPGNVQAGAITIIKRALPSVDRVSNPFAAGGGADLEDLESVKDRGPLVLRHRDRAITAEDYESLAREASRQVARARCLPARDSASAGKVSVLIVPEGGPRPLPTPGLLRRVKAHLDERRLPTADLSLFGPSYVDVSVAAAVVPVSFDEADAVRQRVLDALTAYFHPLTGGPEGVGWAFGRDVYLSEVASHIEAIEGVDHLSRATLEGWAGEDDRAREAGRRVEVRGNAGELVASGGHTVTLATA